MTRQYTHHKKKYPTYDDVVCVQAPRLKKAMRFDDKEYAWLGDFSQMYYQLQLLKLRHDPDKEEKAKELLRENLKKCQIIDGWCDEIWEKRQAAESAAEKDQEVPHDEN